jgi:arylsulfatase A-like enzyme/tetratricopeptide (TPR) repeat protein
MRRRLRRAAFGIALALAVLRCFSGCRRAAEPAHAAPPTPARASGRTNLLLITLDTLRPDALGFVAGRNATPALDGLAREGFAFPGAVSPVPLTFPSHSALMTGMLPRALGLRDNGQLLPPQPPTLAERLAARGYATAAFVSGYPLHSAFGLDRGFSHYDDAFDSGKGDESERRAGATVAAAKAWLASTKAKAPWFLWVHLYDPHYPYEPPPEFRRPGPRGAYDGEVAYADSAIGDLLRAAAAVDAAAPASASSSSTLTVFAGDHGESLGEHGEGTHGFFVYDSTALVPLVFRLPGRVPVGSSAAGARLIDVAPTILDLLGVPAAASERADGRSLAPLWRGGGATPAAGAPAYVETYQPWLSYGWSPLRAMRADGWKLIDAPRPELYDLGADPGETHDRFADSPAEARRLKLLLRQVQDTAAAPPSPAADAEALARLRSLGYLGGSTPEAEPPASMRGLRDPKDGAAVRELLTRGDELLRRGEARAAAIRFESALEQDPDNRFALHRSGLALLQLGQLPRALSRLEKTVRLGPDQPEARWALAAALERSGRLAEAVAQWEEVVRLQPRRAEAWANLGSALGRSGKTKEAATALAHAVELSPHDPDLLARLAFAEFGAGDVAGAARHLREESEHRAPGTFRHSGALGILLAQLGRAEDALPYLRASGPEEPEYAEARLKLASLEADAGRESEARRALADALRASPSLRTRVLADARLSKLLP